MKLDGDWISLKMSHIDDLDRIGSTSSLHQNLLIRSYLFVELIMLDQILMLMIDSHISHLFLNLLSISSRGCIVQFKHAINPSLASFHAHHAHVDVMIGGAISTLRCRNRSVYWNRCKDPRSMDGAIHGASMAIGQCIGTSSIDSRLKMGQGKFST